MKFLSLDLESRSTINLKKVGAYRYADHPDTEITLAAYHLWGERYHLWDYFETPDLPDDLIALLRDPDVIVVAFNANFERQMLRAVWGIDLPPERFMCILAWSYSLSFVGELEEVGAQMNLSEEEQKLASGSRLIEKFCKPRPPSKANKKLYWEPAEAPEDWKAFREYCIQDIVTVEHMIRKYLWDRPMLAVEWSYYRMHERMNDLGVPVDRDLIDRALELREMEFNRIKALLEERTGVGNANSVKQMLEYLQQFVLHLDNMQVETLERLSKDLGPNDLIDSTPVEWRDQVTTAVKWTLIQYSQMKKSAPTKWNAFDVYARKDGTIGGMTQFLGASRTGRPSGRGPQILNLYRGSLKDPEQIADRLLTCSPEELCAETGLSLMEILSSTVRCAVTAPEGRRIVAADLGSIESRYVATTSRCKRMLDIFASGKDTYIQFATLMFGKPYEDITKDERTFCKPPVLGIPYGMGPEGLVSYAEGMGITLSLDFTERAVGIFRREYPEIKKMANWSHAAAIQCVGTGRPVSGYRLHFSMDGDFLRVTLPSGRPLFYHLPKIENGRFGSPGVTYMGRDQYTRKWERLQSHPGKWVEQPTQAGSRDIMYDAMGRCLDKGIDLRFQVYDEAVGLSQTVESAQSELDLMIKELSTPPPWMSDILLTAEGWTGQRFRKD